MRSRSLSPATCSRLDWGRALSMATPDAAAKVTASRSSSSLNWSALCLSARYRLPMASLPRIGTPRNDVISGCPGGKPCASGCSLTSRNRTGFGSLRRTPRMPSNSGRRPTASCVCSSTPLVTRSVSWPCSSMTPKAPYLASTSLQADSTIRCRTVGRLRSEPMLSIASSSCWRRTSNRCTLATIGDFGPEATIWEVSPLRRGTQRVGAGPTAGCPPIDTSRCSVSDSALGVEHPEPVRHGPVGAHALGELVADPLELSGLEALLLGPLVDLGLVLEAGARHGLAELGVLVERDALDGLEPRVIGVLGAVDEPRLSRRRLRLGGLLRRRRVLGGLGGTAEGALDVLEEAHGRFLLVLSSDRSIAAVGPATSTPAT